MAKARKPKYVTVAELERVRMGLVHDLEQFKSDERARYKREGPHIVTREMLHELRREIVDTVNRAIADSKKVTPIVSKPWYKCLLNWLWHE